MLIVLLVGSARRIDASGGGASRAGGSVLGSRLAHRDLKVLTRHRRVLGLGSAVATHRSAQSRHQSRQTHEKKPKHARNLDGVAIVLACPTEHWRDQPMLDQLCHRDENGGNREIEGGLRARANAAPNAAARVERPGNALVQRPDSCAATMPANFAASGSQMILSCHIRTPLTAASGSSSLSSRI